MADRKSTQPGFDFSKAKGPRATPVVGGDEAAAQAPPPWPVSLLVRHIKESLSECFPAAISVVGEISNFKRHSSGHLYFRLKDANAAIDAVMFRTAAARLKFEPADGLEVVAQGRIDVYDQRGQLQICIDRLSPKGAGELELAFQQLRAKLQAEGLFDAAAKKPLPMYPRAIGLITSPTGAAVRDIARTLARRWPAADVYLLPVMVQGAEAAGQVAAAVALLDAGAGRLNIDTLIVARGGGSLEDLWAFNEEIVARAIFAARTPIVCGVGHEVDVTIADLVADVRAATPTAAAELAVPDADAVRRGVATLAGRMTRRVGETVRSARAELTGLLRSSVFRDPGAAVRTHTRRVDELSHCLASGLAAQVAQARRAMEAPAAALAGLHPVRLVDRARAAVDALQASLRWNLGARAKRGGESLLRLEGRLTAALPRHRLALARQRVEAAARQLEAMSYRSVLARGFSVTRDSRGQIVRSAAAVAAGEILSTQVSDGAIASRVMGGGEGGPPPPAAAPARRSKKHSPDSGPGLFDDKPSQPRQDEP
ncbi:MAG: exodeoxyribonuclease VII large subunit [Planctomycetaceae bacterium]|nr:exodeoxyribonuclease VII large subunit [Planctomycetaceae bacterium]